MSADGNDVDRIERGEEANASRCHESCSHECFGMSVSKEPKKNKI